MSNEEIVEQIRSTAGEDRSEYLLLLYDQNRGLMYSIAKRYAAFEDTEDLMQEAFIGLVEAADSYNADQGSFTTYAFYHIRKAIKRYLDNSGTVIRLPVHIRSLIYRMNEMVKDYNIKYNRNPSDDEMTVALMIDCGKLEKLKEYAKCEKVTSLDQFVQSDAESMTVGDIIPDPMDHYEDLIRHTDGAKLSGILWHEVDALKQKEKEVLCKRYIEGRTLQDIGTEYGCTRENVRVIQKRALNKLRKQLKGYML